MYHLIIHFFYVTVFSYVTHFSSTKVECRVAIGNQLDFVFQGESKYTSSCFANVSYTMNCSLFVQTQCQGKTENILLKACPSTQLFDATLGSCQVKENVDCSSHSTHKGKMGHQKRNSAARRGEEMQKILRRRKREELDLNRRSRPWGKFINGKYIPYLVVEGGQSLECKDTNDIVNKTKSVANAGVDNKTVSIEKKMKANLGRMAQHGIKKEPQNDFPTVNSQPKLDEPILGALKKAEPKIVYDDEITEPEMILPVYTANHKIKSIGPRGKSINKQIGKKKIVFLDDDLTGGVKGEANRGRFMKPKFFVATQKPNEALQLGVEDDEEII